MSAFARLSGVHLRLQGDISLITYNRLSCSALKLINNKHQRVSPHVLLAIEEAEKTLVDLVRAAGELLEVGYFNCGDVAAFI